MTTIKNSTNKEKAERRKVVDEIIEKASFYRAVEFAWTNEVSKDLIEKRFIKELEEEIRKIKVPYSRLGEKYFDISKRKRNIKEAQDIAKLLNHHKIYPYKLIDDTVKFLLADLNFLVEAPNLAQFGSQKIKELVAKTFLKRNINLNDVVKLRGREWSLSELKEYLERTKNHDFQPSEYEFDWD